jgi:two-component system, chemotaxis family, response regulator Rcp1
MRTSARGKPIAILVVEDSPADIRLLQEVCKELNVQTQWSLVHDGTEALAFLRREGPYAQAAQPDFILLDLNLPGKTGLEVLAEVSAEPRLRRIPSVVLSSSQAAEDIVRSYELCANCYVVKPLNLDDFRRLVQMLHDFWLTAAELPTFRTRVE